jgi:tRNA threonylcarbamoyladenosine biosynthesis protein TsaE
VIIARTSDPSSTMALAGAVATLVRPGDLLLLAGDLGAGKTTFAKGFAAALGVEEPVTSPTFTLVRHYSGSLPVNHVDVYRLERLAELTDLGLAELLDAGGVTLVEWGDAVTSALPADYLEVRLSALADGNDEERVVVLRTVGASWSLRLAAVRDATGAWAC